MKGALVKDNQMWFVKYLDKYIWLHNDDIKGIKDREYWQAFTLEDFNGLEVEFVKEWKSIKSAAEFYKISTTSIIHAINGKKRKSVNFQWKEWSKDFKLKIEPIKKIERPNRRGRKLNYIHPSSKKIGFYNHNNELIETFTSISKAGEKLNIKASTIHDIVENNRKKSKYGRFKYL
jgi:hypothetical protein